MVGKLITRVFFTSVLWLIVSAAQAMDVASIQVSSSGSVEVLPDYITIDVSIEKTDMDRAVAKKQADEITQQVLDATLALGVKDEHIDGDCFRLFVASGVYLRYAQAFLPPDQIDAVPEQEYLSA